MFEKPTTKMVTSIEQLQINVTELTKHNANNSRNIDKYTRQIVN